MRIHNLLLRNVLIVVSAFVLIACQPTTSPTQGPQDNGIQDIRVQAVEPVRTTTKVEQFPLPNCGGTDKLEQSLGTYASASKSATVGDKATLTGGGEVGIPETIKLKLEIQVELAYQQTFESANSRLDSIKMSAAAGTHVVYTIVWEEQAFNSIVQYSSDGMVYEAPYTYKLSVPKIDTSYNLACLEPTQRPDNGNPTATAIVAVNTQTTTSGLFVCGEPAFNENLQTTDPLFLRPEGYLSGWISSDPSTIVLPDGTVEVFETQYVLIVEDLPSVQVKGVQRQAGKANTWGCWYSADLSAFIAEDAKTDFCKKKAGGNIAVMYRVSSSGFEELATTATISCP